MMRSAFVTMVVAGLMSGPALADQDGAALFEAHCAACHSSGGVGTPGFAPALDRPEFWQDLGEDAAPYLTGVMVKGFAAPITVRGERFMGMVMPGVNGASAEELAQIGNWVLADLGQVEQSITPEEVTAARDSDLTHADLKDMRPKTE
ncbi:Cytochrome c [Paracoccus homiensis]|uniref:Cytochrome c n=2 Tax=Paracoccus homiensis TaxID=364199 RepID=A0A1I0H6L3_9RHOB|nr:Cytochrome c [Paracoccus homiensis]